MGLISALFGLFLHQEYLKVPDGYQIDLEREPPAYAIPRDRSNIVRRLPQRRRRRQLESRPLESVSGAAARLR